jgi:8-oxo-dGTP diphosphatase
MIHKQKAFAYITRDKELLAFVHPFSPEAGIQVPAGTIDPDETPEQAVIREATEETGLMGLRVLGFLGEYERDMRDFDKQEIHHRHYFHLVCDLPMPDQWTHGELDPDHTQDGIVKPFDFYWVNLETEDPHLIADHDKFLPQLKTRLGIVHV